MELFDCRVSSSSLFATALILLLLVGHEGRTSEGRGEWLWKKERTEDGG